MHPVDEYKKFRDLPEKAPVCLAPFTNLNFDIRGNATACCYNKKVILGNVANSSIREIWNSKAADELRRSLRNDDLGNGCRGCFYNLKSGNFQNVLINGFNAHYAPGEGEYDKTPYPAPPRTVEFEIHNTCNLECVMCNGKFSSLIRQNRENLRPIKSPYGDGFLEELKTIIPHLKEARFLGGEPFLNPYYFRIWEIIKELNPGVKIFITTNGTVLTGKIREYMKALNMHIVISIDSMEQDNFEKIRTRGNFQQLQKNITYFQEYMNAKDEPLHFTSCPLVYNWQEIPALVKYCNRNNIRLAFNTVVHPVHLSLFHKTSAFKEKVLTAWENVVFEAGSSISASNVEAFTGLKNQLKSSRTGSVETEALYRQIAEQSFGSGSDYISGHLLNSLYFGENGEPEIKTVTAFQKQVTNPKGLLKALNRTLNFIADRNGNSIKSENLKTLNRFILGHESPQYVMRSILDFDLQDIAGQLSALEPLELYGQIDYQFS